MSVHYKFKTGLSSDKVTFDGVHISVGDLKKAIMQQKKIGKSADFDLQITNQQTKEVYESEDVLIPKNTTVIIARVPVSGVKKHWERSEQSTSSNNSPAHIALEKIIRSSDLSNSDASEEEKIKQMMTQSTQEYDSSKFVKSRGMVGPLPPNYTCYRCGQPGHYIKHCPTNNMEIKRSTGIPRSFMIPASADQKGALLTASGEYAVPIIDHEAYKEVKKEKPPFFPSTETEGNETDADIPENLQCMLCRDLMQDAVLIHCCGSSYCDECIRTNLLESEQHECPTCHSVGISPDTLIPNRFLRAAVMKFKNETGYSKQKRQDSLSKDEEKDSFNGSLQEAVVNETSERDIQSMEEKFEIKGEPSNETEMSPMQNVCEEIANEVPTIDEVLVGNKDENETKETLNESETDNVINIPINDVSADSQPLDAGIADTLEDQKRKEVANDEHEEFSECSTNEMMYANTNNRTTKQSMSIRNVIRPVTSVVPQTMQMHRAPILPHPPRGIFPRPGIPPDPRFYRTPLRDPHGYSLALGPGPYGYGGPPLRPHAYPDPYFLGHRPPHIHSAQFPRPHIGGHHQAYNEPPPPGSSPRNTVAEGAYGHFPNATSAGEYEDAFEKFTKQLQSKPRRKRLSRSRSKSRGRSRSRSRTRRTRSRSTTSNSSSSKSRSLSFTTSYSGSSRSRSRSPYAKKSMCNYRKRYSRSRSPRHRHDYRYRRSPSHRYSSSRRYISQPRRSPERDRYDSRSRRRHLYSANNHQPHADTPTRGRVPCKTAVKEKPKKSSQRHSSEKTKLTEQHSEEGEKIVVNEELVDNNTILEFSEKDAKGKDITSTTTECEKPQIVLKKEKDDYEKYEKIVKSDTDVNQKTSEQNPSAEEVESQQVSDSKQAFEADGKNKIEKGVSKKEDSSEKAQKATKCKSDKINESKSDKRKVNSELEAKEKEKNMESVDKHKKDRDKDKDKDKDKYDKHRHYKSKRESKEEAKPESRTKKDRKESTDDDSKKKHKHRKHKHHSEPSRKKTKKSVTKDEKSKSKEQPKSSKRKSLCK